MNLDTKTITLALDVMALNIPDGKSCDIIKSASARLIELDDKYKKSVAALESIAFAKLHIWNKQDLSDKGMNALIALGEYKRVNEPANVKSSHSEL
jgi:hypothetical protein